MKLEIKDLHVAVEGKEILKGLTLTVKEGEIVALMGPNGSGKSTLSHTLMGHPKYEVVSGSILYNGKDVLSLEPEERSKLGLFLSYQNPVAIPGLIVMDYLKELYKIHTGKEVKIIEWKRKLEELLHSLHIEKSFVKRYLNDGFSGGEKKRMEILQMAVVNPTLAILDETDSGLDIDALKSVSEGVSSLKHEKMSILVITHYQRILHHLQPDRVVILKDGRIVEEGGNELVEKLEKEGYAWLK